MATPKIHVETLRPHLSFSQLSTYLECSMKYYFRYVLGWKGRPNIHMARGSAGHTALEKNGLHKMEAKVDQPLEQILDNFSDAWTYELSEFEPNDYMPGDNPDREKDNTVELLRYHRLSRGEDGALASTPLAIELDFMVPLPPTDQDPDPKPITGKIDRIESKKRVVVANARPIERTAVVDYKFPARKPSNAQDKALMSSQLTMYDHVLTRIGKPTDDLGFVNFVPPTKTIGPRVEPVYRPPTAMIPARREQRQHRLLYTLSQVQRDIADGRWKPVDDPRVCANCPFRQRCQDSLVKSDFDAILLTGRHA